MCIALYQCEDHFGDVPDRVSLSVSAMGADPGAVLGDVFCNLVTAVAFGRFDLYDTRDLTRLLL